MGFFAGWAPGLNSDTISSQQMRSNPDKPVFRVEKKYFQELKLTRFQKFSLFLLKVLGYKDYVEEVYSKIKEINKVNKYDYIENKWYGRDPEKEFECSCCGEIFDRSLIRFNLCSKCRGETGDAAKATILKSVVSAADLPKNAKAGTIIFVENDSINYVYTNEGWIKIQESLLQKNICEDCGALVNEFNSYVYIVDGRNHIYCSKCFIVHRKSGEKVNFTSTWGKI